jgi:hypothetical protein
MTDTATIIDQFNAAFIERAPHKRMRFTPR